MRQTLTVMMMAALLSAGSVVADEPQQGQQDLDISQIMTTMMGAGGAKPTTAGGLPDFESVTKDMVADKGLFTLWHYPESAKDKDSEKLLCQIPASFLGQNFMLSTSISGGGFFTGFPWEERVVRWELLDKQLLLVEPETRFVVDKSEEVSDAVQRTYPERIRVAIPLVTKSSEGDPVIDLGAFLKSDFAGITFAIFNPLTGAVSPPGMVNGALSKWTKKKTFDLNVEIGVELAVSQMYPKGSYDKKIVHFSFWKLPESDYTPRVADDRVGYFLTANQDWARPSSSRDLFNRYIDRWHLVKRDPELKLCGPKQPIIFYIEKTVPVKYRRAVRDGILEWNKSYEKVGFVNAIEVRQQEDDNEWADLDPEDMRYSFFRWIVTGAGFAMGPHRANPFTGQIYDADIIFDDSMVRYFEQEADQMLVEEALSYKNADPGRKAFLEAHPEWQRPLPTHLQPTNEDHADAAYRQAVMQRMHDRGFHGCDFLQGMRHQMALAGTVLTDQPQEVKDRFMYDVIKEVVMHEVGHTLGLRHNFKGSSIYTVEEIRERSEQGLATTGSVMDYNPTLFFQDGFKDGHFLTPTIGPYDYWAIEYGYRPADGTYQAQAKPDADKAETAADAHQTAVKVDMPAKAASLNSAEIQQALKNMPPEILAQLPPEVKKALESGNVEALVASAGSAPASAATSGATPQSASAQFKAAPSGEEAMLQAIARRSGEPELAYATDEDTTIYGIDPLSNRFDLSADPLVWAEDRINLVNQRMQTIMDWAVKDQESWYYLRQAFIRLLYEKTLVLDYVGRFIGGQYYHRSHRGDPDALPPFTLVDAETQRKALDFIDQHLFEDEFFSFSPAVLNHLATNRWYHTGSNPSYTVDFPTHDLIGVFQWWNLSDRLFPDTFRRIQDAELKSTEADKFTVAEYIQKVQNACWEAAYDTKYAKTRSWSDSKPFITDVQRSLQREYLNLMEPLVRYKPGVVVSPDLHAMLQYSLQDLNSKIQNTLDNGQIDFASRAHLAACQSRIERMLAVQLDEYEG